DRQPVQRGEIQRFVEGPLIDGAVAEEAKRNSIFAPVLDCQGQPNSQRYMRGYDRVTAKHVVSLVKKMHRPPESTRAAGLFSKKLRHACIRARALSQGMPVITVSSDYVIIRPHGSNR